jgi:hypothetical protein
MPNINSNPENVNRRRQLFQIGQQFLEDEGWTVSRVPGAGKASLRRITKGKENRTICIRTSQDQWMAFPRNTSDTGWVTLDEVNEVIVVAVDDRSEPKFALVHRISGDEMRERFNRAYSARRAARYSEAPGRPMWISLYDEDKTQPVGHVGAGAGLSNPPIVRVPLQSKPDNDSDKSSQQVSVANVPLPFDQIILEAKHSLALRLGVVSAIIRIALLS